MRTDPRADEVRRIVERVFSDYLLPDSTGSKEIACDFNDRRAQPFPRLYQPQRPEDRCSHPVPADRCAVPVLRSCGAENPAPRSGLVIDERILIDEGRYVARSYRTRGYMAMWLLPIGIVQFYDEHGRMLATVNLFQALRPKAAAA